MTPVKKTRPIVEIASAAEPRVVRASPSKGGDTEPSRSRIRSLLVQAVAAAIDRPAEQIDENASLAQLGIDSLAGADVLLSMERELGHRLDDDLVTPGESIVSLAQIIGGRPARDEG